MKGKVTIITGGSGGIGYEVARGLAEAGSNIALFYFKSSNAGKLAAKLEKDFGIRSKAYQCDVAEWAAVQSNVDQVVQDFGRLDVMIANAGIPSKAGGLDDRLEDFYRVTDVSQENRRLRAKLSTCRLTSQEPITVPVRQARSSDVRAKGI